ncbi:MAG TPA: GntR family transcriptional regulator [Candidatus Limnocylindria bacterium]|jgi:GntR family transcriptional regulator|nr:GntR family transcriptional regulator [Candidatus Limnocylindria bacterium]
MLRRKVPPPALELEPLPASLPIHELIQRTIRRRIETGELTEGRQLPSEAELQREFQASRTPVRQALRRLQSDGLIVRAQGKGSFVASAKIGVALRPMVSFGNELRRQGHDVDARTLSVEWAAAPMEVVQWLGLEDGQGTHIRRLLTVDGVPLTYFEHWLAPTVPHAVIVAAGSFPSLYELLHEHGREPWYGTETIGAAVADREMAELLAYEEGAPLVTLLRISRDVERRPVEYTHYVVRADRYEYEINLMRQRR